MKTIFTLDSKTRLTPAAYDSIKAVIEREGYKATLGLMKHTLGYKTCVMVEGDVDATMFCVKIARSYGEKELIIVNDFNAHIYRLHTQEMITSGVWTVSKREPNDNHYFIDGMYYQVSKPLPMGKTWN